MCGRAPDQGGGAREETAIQADQCFLQMRPQDELVTTLVGVDDSVGRYVAICVERKGARDVLGGEGAFGVRAITGPSRDWSYSDGGVKDGLGGGGSEKTCHVFRFGEGGGEGSELDPSPLLLPPPLPPKKTKNLTFSDMS